MSMREFFMGALILSLCGRTIGQTAAARPEFEVATVKLSVTGDNVMGFDMLPSGLFRATNTPMSTLFRFAYDVSDQTTAGAPDWFNNDRYDVAGKAQPGTPYPVLRALLQSLLAEQIKLVVHTEPRMMSAYALLVPKSLTKLQSADGTEKTGCIPVGAQGPDAGGRHLQCTNTTMPELAHALPGIAPAYVDKPVIDQTGLTGAYNFRLDWVGAGQIDSAGGLTLFGALEKLGLKLESKKLAVPVVVVDHVEKPAPN
jgi:bla regulator protein blaR1